MIMIKRLLLNNFKKHEQLDIEFGPGLNGIVGPNYRGKTTVLLGILFCLGGATAVPTKTVQRNGTNTGFDQQMWFMLGDDEYHVRRTKSKAELKKNDTLVCNGATEVNREIAALLGMNMKRFRMLKWAKQNETAAILTIGVTMLFNVVSELTGISDVNEALDKLDAIRKVAKSRLEDLPALVDVPAAEKELEVAEAAETKANVALGAAEKAHTKARAGADAASAMLEKATQVIAAYERTHTAHANWAEKLDLAQGRAGDHNDAVEALIGQKAQVDAQAEISLEIARLNESLEAANTLKTAATLAAREKQRVRGVLQAATEAVEKQVKALDEAAALRAKAPNPGKSVDTLVQQQSDLKAQIAALSKDISDDKAGLTADTCPTCHRAYEQSEEHSAHQAETLARIERSETQLAEMQDVTAPALTKLLAQARQLVAVDEAFSRAAELKAAADKQLKEATAAATTAIAEAKKAGSPEDQATAIELANAALRDTIVKNAKLELAFKQQRASAAELADLQKAEPAKPGKAPHTPAQVDALRQARADSTALALDAYRRVQEANLDLNGACLLAKQAQQTVTVARESHEKIIAATARLDIANQLDKYLRASRDRFSADVWTQFMARASLFVATCTGGAITQVDRDEETGVFRYLEGEDWLPVSEASGCQQAVMGIAVQEALADAARCPLDILLADEISASMDTTHSLAVMSMLASSGKQVITVSHEELDNSVFNHVIQL